MPGTQQFTVVVRCADPRLEAFFTQPGSRDAMGLSSERAPLSEAHIANVGGLLPLAGAEVPRLVHDAGLLIKLFSGERSRIVLTAHSSCGGYRDAVEGDESSAVRARQEDDLRTTAHRLRAALGVSVDCYFLDLESGRVEAVAS